MAGAQAAAMNRQCWRCGVTGAASLVCARCDAVQPLSVEADLFAILGFPRRLAVDSAELERRYHAASRAVHPDRHQTADDRQRELSLAASAAVNRAYRTLRDPVARGRYWLELHGTRLGDEGARVPPAIAADVFETQEKLEALRAASADAALRAEVRELRERFAARLESLRSELLADYDADDRGPALEELRRRLAEIAYLRTLLGDIDDTIGEGFRGSDHRH
jgi:molecular chaperone HscB